VIEVRLLLSVDRSQGGAAAAATVALAKVLKTETGGRVCGVDFSGA